MEVENTNIEYKSLRKVVGSKASLRDLSVTCVCLANAQGGTIYVGIEDGTKEPPVNQIIEQELVNKVLGSLRELTDSVGFGDSNIERHPNGGQYFYFKILPSSRIIATTSSGKIFIRIQDRCYPVSGEEVTRLAAEKNAFQWELVEVKAALLNQIPKKNIADFVTDIRFSERVKAYIKEKDNHELLEHYNLVNGNTLTNLGVIWLGTPAMRSRIAYPLTVQYLVYDDKEEKIRKENWHDADLNPKQLILAIEKQATELNYYYEFPQGLFRKRINQYAKEVVRELLINAIAHKKYTISGDIFIEVYADRLEITNPGNLPLGITKNNILHSRHRRNPQMIRIFHDLGMMEGEGSGYDLIYELDSKDNKPFPIIYSEFDFTKVVQSSEILDHEVTYLMEYISKHYALSQKQFIALGIIAREKKVLTTELYAQLQLPEESRLRSYVNKMVEDGILVTRGIKKGTQYLINPSLIKASSLNIKPTLKTIEPHVLKALIEQDLELYPESKISEIANRIPEVSYKDLQKAVYDLVKEERILHSSDKTYRKYWLAKKKRK